MHMIRHATRPVTFATGIARDRRQVGVEFGARLGIEQGAAVFRAENDVNNNKAKRLWHTEEYGPTAQAWTHTKHERHRRDSFTRPCSWRGGERRHCGEMDRAFSPCYVCHEF